MVSRVELFPLDAMDSGLVQSVTLLLVAILVAVAARRVNLPYTVGLVIAGVVMAATRLGSGTMLTHDFIFDVILPPLLFEASISLHWDELKRDAVPVTVLSILGVIIAAIVVGIGMVWLLHWPAAPAALFGVLIAATDPVAVIALFKDTGVKGRLRLLVESESLFNDGVAAVLFGLVLSWVEATPGQALGVTDVARELLITAGGGTLIGAVSGGFAIVIAGRTKDHLVETAVTTVAAYGSFLLAQHFGASGVLAVVTAGLIMGNVGVLAEHGRNRLSAQGRAFVVAFWEFAAFVANSLVFLLIGLKIGAMPILTPGGANGPLASCRRLAGRRCRGRVRADRRSRSSRRIPGNSPAARSRCRPGHRRPAARRNSPAAADNNRVPVRRIRRHSHRRRRGHRPGDSHRIPDPRSGRCCCR